jgi:hypothetical protein
VERTFLDGLLARPPVVLGRTLRPFTIGHSLILQALGHPLIRGEPLSPFDCLQAIHVCTRTFAEARDWMWSIDGEPETAVEGPRVFDALKVSRLLEQYYRHAVEAPEILMDEQSRDLNHPLELSLIVGLRSMGATLDEALNEGYRLALWQCLARNERPLVSERTMWIRDHADEIVRQAQADMKLHPVKQGNIRDKRKEPAHG